MLARLQPRPTTAAGALSRGPASARAVRSLSSALGVPLPVAPAAEVKPGRTAQAFYRNLPVSPKKLRVVANLTPKLYWREAMMQLEFCRTPGAGDARPLAPPPPPLRCAATPEAAEPLTPLLCFGSISLGVDAPAPCEMPYLELPPLPSLEPLAAKGKKGWRTYQPNVLKRKRTHGFLHRMSTRAGRNTLSRRRRKGRWQIAVT